MKTIKLLVIQLVISAVLSYLGAISLYGGAVLFNICQFAVLPIAGCVTTYKITVRGVNNYLAWIIPPFMGIFAHFLAFFYLPKNPGPFLACAVVSIIGAAAGDVAKKSNKSK